MSYEGTQKLSNSQLAEIIWTRRKFFIAYGSRRILQDFKRAEGSFGALREPGGSRGGIFFFLQPLIEGIGFSRN